MIASLIIIMICIPMLGFWCAVAYRLLLEQREAEGRSDTKPPSIFTQMFASY